LVFSASRLNFSALAYVMEKALTRASVKWWPPMGNVRIHTRPASATIRSVDVVPIVQDDRARRLLGELQVEGHGVVGRDRGERHEVRDDPDILVHRQPLHDPLARDREDADLDVGGIGLLERLVVPLDLVDGEGDLLHRLELDDVRDLLGVHGGSLAKRANAEWPGTETATLTPVRSTWLARAPKATRIASFWSGPASRELSYEG
jgi:hypothetical protein